MTTTNEVDTPRPEPVTLKKGKATGGPFYVKASMLMTGEFVGYLACTSGYYLYIEHDENNSAVCVCNWSYAQNQLWLQVINQGQSNRYIGVGSKQAADLGLWTSTGWVDAVVLNPDKTIGLASAPSTVLGLPYGAGYDVYWGSGATTLKFDFPSAS